MTVRDLREFVQEMVRSLGALRRQPGQVVELRPDPQWAAEREADRAPLRLVDSETHLEDPPPAGGHCRGCGVGIDWWTQAQLCHSCVMGRTRR